MTIVRRVARPLLAGIFITGGLDAIKNPSWRVQTAEPVAPKLAKPIPFLPETDTEQLVKIDAGVKLVGGLMLATGRLPRLAAVALAGSLAATTAAGHRFWEEEDPTQKANQRIHFTKNLAVLGGLLLAAVDTAGKPSLGWRARRAAKRTRQVSKLAGKTAGKTARTVS